MSASAAAFSQSWTVGAFTATLTVPKPQPGQVLGAVIAWTPSTPARLTDEELAQYRTGRNAAFQAMTQQLGIRSALVEL